jgi:hypothetical protein
MCIHVIFWCLLCAQVFLIMYCVYDNIVCIELHVMYVCTFM